MKKTTVLCAIALIVCLLTGCVEHIQDDKPGIDPIEGASGVDNPSPAPQVNTQNIPSGSITNPTDPTEPDDPDPNDPGQDKPDPADQDGKITLNTIAKDTVSKAVSGYPSNAEFSAKGDKIDRRVSGDTIIYRVKYAKTITYIVELTRQGDQLTVKASLEHYRLNLNPDKPITVRIGDHAATALSPEINWKSNDSAAHSTLVSASAPLDGKDSVKVEISMPYGGTYHGESIESFTFDQTITLAN